MNVLVVGASGATGSLLVQQLLQKEHQVKAIVRSPERFGKKIPAQKGLTVVGASLLDLSDDVMAAHVRDCDAVASCLGHNLTWKGVYGEPRKLVTDATRRLCKAIEANKPSKPVKFVLMNTAGNSNRDLLEPISIGQRVVIGLLRLLLPPHVDNEQASDFLHTQIGQQHPHVQWVVVRPDNLIDNQEVSAYTLHPSPTRSAIFNAGKTSRINVGHVMAELISVSGLWEKWKGQMPVVYNTE